MEENIVEKLYQAYVYAIPLVMYHLQRISSTNTVKATSTKAPVNQYIHAEGLADGEAKYIVMLNMDTVYSHIYFDLRKEPIYVKKPASDRYNSFEFIDAYGDYIDILGTGFVGGNEEVEAVLVGPDYKGELPEDVYVIHSPTNDLWGFIRILSKTTDNADYKNIKKIQEGYEVRPLSSRKKAYVQPDGIYQPENDFVPFEKINQLSTEEVFAIFNKNIQANPGKNYDRELLESVAEYGIGSGKTFLLENLPKAVQNEAAAFHERMLEEFENSRYGSLVGDWMLSDSSIADFKKNYIFRANIAWGGAGANPVEMAIYPSHLLKTGKDTIVHFFEKPPVRMTEGGFWSISIYGLDKFAIPNEMNRFGLNDRSDLVYNEDGSFDILIQKERPEGEMVRNWLPNGGQPSLIVLRFYLPTKQLLNNEWKYPEIKEG
ncbi:DUF1254 domain-containing protein [Roseburia hominis]|uniref:DUF1254 domain-containing protein n=1 Tax=Roseburia hominis TaxID=301301 RepID=UPI001F2E6F9D|nr:DUF1254 domain-containing protein [Roseburia hominis]